MLPLLSTEYTAIPELALPVATYTNWWSEAVGVGLEEGLGDGLGEALGDGDGDGDTLAEGLGLGAKPENVFGAKLGALLS